VAGQLRRVAWRTAAIAAILVGVLVLGVLVPRPAFAQDATWQAAPTVTNPVDGNFDFNANANWTPATAPGSVSQTGTATFGATTANGANISFSAGSTTLGGFTFTAAASNYAFFNSNNVSSLTFDGAGIVVNGGSATITNNGFGSATAFINASTAGGAAITNNSGGNTNFGQSGGTDTASAGNASITNNGGGTTQFFANTTAGNATITNNGSVVEGVAFAFFNDTSTAGSATITNNGGSQTVFFANSTAGSATITNNSNGFTVFGQFGGTDTSTAGTATITNNGGGSTQFSASTTAGSATITNNGSLAGAANTLFNDTSTAGSATITNNSFGLTQFSNASTAGNATITNNGGGTTFGQSGGTDTASAGSAVITNNSGGMTQFFANTTAGNAAIMNNGSLAGPALTLFNDTSTAGSATITNNSFGLTQFSNASTAGNATIMNNVGGATQFGSPGGTDTASAGNAVITNNNRGLTTFVGNSTAGSAAITNNSGQTLFGGDGGAATAGSATIVINRGITFFAGSSSAGNANITNNGLGPGLSSVTQFTVDSTAGNATITNNGLNTFTQFTVDSTAGNATITNRGGVVQFFNGSDGGTATLINAGGLIDFSQSSGPLGNGVLNVGSLQGSGTFNVLSSQHVNVSGSLAFTSGALYIVNVRGSNASQINVTGAATLAGIVGVQANTRVMQTTTFTILTSGGLNGMFSGATLEFTNNFARDPVLSYVGNNVLLTLQPGLLSPILPNNSPANQVKVAAAIDNGLLAGNNLTNAFSAIFNLSSNALLNGLTQISGETATGSQQTTFNAMGQFMGLLTDPFLNRGGGLNGSASPLGYADEASAYAASKPSDAFAMFTKASPSHPSPASGGGSGWGFEPRWSVWAAGFGGSQLTSGNAALGSNNTTSNIAATAVGADYLFSPNTIAGFALAGGGTSFNVANGGTGRSDLFQAGVYLRHTEGAAYISGALAYGWQDITTNRTLMVAGLDRLGAEFNANAWSGRLEGGYRFVTPALGGLGITPYAAAQFVTFDLPAYAEQAAIGLNTFALSYGSRDVTDARSELGIRTDKSWAMSDGILTLRGRLAWAHDFDPNRSIAATFQTLPAASFVVNGAAQASDSALTTAAVEMKWKNGWSASATFEGEFSAVTNSYAGKGVVRYQW
jgi:uncharacterized protein with beta-barrel porin domain